MAIRVPQHGEFELKLSEDRTVVLATIRPAPDGGDEVTVEGVCARLKSIGVTAGIRDQCIRDAIKHATDLNRAVTNIMVAVGAVPKAGTDARVQYHIPIELLAVPLPKHPDGFPIPEWFALDPRKIVSRGKELVSIIPPQPGVAGRTVAVPIQSVAPKSGNGADVRPGANVEFADATRLIATSEGYACLSGGILTVHALRIFEEDIHDDQLLSVGLIVRGNAIQVDIRTASFIAIKGMAAACRLRADGDIVISSAENCDIITAGSVYVLKCLKNCRVIARKNLMVRTGGAIIGGSVHAFSGVEATDVGAEDFTSTEIRTGIDHFSDVRNQEIQEELNACEANIKRIRHALQPFTTHSGHMSLSDDKRTLLQRLQLQARNQDGRISQLHTERRSLTLLRNERSPGLVSIVGTVWPGVWITICDAATQIEAPMANVRFQQAANRKSVEVLSLLEPAA